MIRLLYIDLFCGAGGTSTGVELATLHGEKCAKVIACVNHDAHYPHSGTVAIGADRRRSTAAAPRRKNGFMGLAGVYQFQQGKRRTTS